MGYALFNDGVYKYLDRGDYVLFSEDKEHRKIFDYVNADLSSIPDLLLKHCSDRMNLDTFKLRSGDKSDNELSQMKAILESAHPYYKHEFDKTIVNAIGEYFNNLLLYLIYPGGNSAFGKKIKYKWYSERLWALMPASFVSQFGEKGPDDFFFEYNDRIGKLNVHKEYYETLVLGVPHYKPVLFSSEISVQKEIANMLYFILDIDAEGINELSLQQRVWLYGNIFDTNLYVTENLSFLEQTVFEGGVDRSQEADEANKLYDIFKPLFSLRNIDVMHYGIPGKIQENFASAVKCAKETASSEIYEKYEIDSLQQLLVLEIVRMIKGKTMIRVCKNCGKYFVIYDKKVVYCDRVCKSGHTCSEVGAKRSFQKKMSEDEALTLYTRAGKKYFARWKNSKISKKELDDWRKEARDKLDKVRNGEYDLEEYKQWLGKKS